MGDPRVRITVHNLGLLEQAEIDLKPLTILVGPALIVGLAVRRVGEEVERKIQLMIEYDPQPLFSPGARASAGLALLAPTSRA